MTTEILPIAGLPLETDPWEALTRWGVVRELDINKVFCRCRLPDYWRKILTNQPIRANLVDSRGLIRAAIYCNDNLEKYDNLFEAYISAFERFGLRPVEKKEKPYVYIYEHFQVFDSGLDRPIFIDNKVECIVAGETLGVIQNKIYHLFNGEKLERAELQKDWVPLSLDNFIAWNKKRRSGNFSSISSRVGSNRLLYSVKKFTQRRFCLERSF